MCRIEGCEKRVLAHGLCSAHYSRWRRHGDPTGGRTPHGEPLIFFEEVALGYEDETCLIWPHGVNSAGYGRVKIDGGNQLVHRLVCKRIHGAPPTPSHEAAHACGVRRCCNPRHLRWATAIENASDRLLHGTDNRGSRHGQSILTEADAMEIRSLRGEKSQKQIAELFGISRSNVSAVQLGKTWGWLSRA